MKHLLLSLFLCTSCPANSRPNENANVPSFVNPGNSHKPDKPEDSDCNNSSVVPEPSTVFGLGLLLLSTVFLSRKKL